MDALYKESIEDCRTIEDFDETAMVQLIEKVWKRNY